MELDVRHVTTFRYTAPVRDSVDEVRLQPRTDASQVCLVIDDTGVPARVLRPRVVG